MILPEGPAPRSYYTGSLFSKFIFDPLLPSTSGRRAPSFPPNVFVFFFFLSPTASDHYSVDFSPLLLPPSPPPVWPQILFSPFRLFYHRRPVLPKSPPLESLPQTPTLSVFWYRPPDPRDFEGPTCMPFNTDRFLFFAQDASLSPCLSRLFFYSWGLISWSNSFLPQRVHLCFTFDRSHVES